MGSDRARISYDPSRQWRGLVAQQGRVTIEADWNEAAAIGAADDRAVTLDVVGPVGTPDAGYHVTANSQQTASPPSGSPVGLIEIGHGTLYLGGERLALDNDLYLPSGTEAQPDWLDTETGTLWIAPDAPPSSPPTGTTNELVYLLAIEQEVGAVEDPALADVALGGPDTTARLRVLQRVVRRLTHEDTCTDAWKEITTAWKRIGLTHEPASMRLQSTAALQVGFVTDPAPASACQPVATGGYLGAENQLIRVQISSVDASGVPTILWGYDDATFLYELASAVPNSGAGTIALALAKPPVDSYHYPVPGQAVELLRDAAHLSPSDPTPPTADGFIAAAAGAVLLTQAYDSSSNTVTVAGSALPPGYDHVNRLYLRVWEKAIQAPADTAVMLTGPGANPGVTVTLSSASRKFHPGDYWCFAMRPSIPNLIYPARYGVAGQSPEGARVLACPLALVSWPHQGAPTVSQCVPEFDNLVELTADKGGAGGCCTIKLTPEDLADTSLNTLLAPYARKGPITVCFAPGTYTLGEPLVLDSTFEGITLESCGGPAVLQAPAEPGPRFLLGLIVLKGPSDVTIRGLDLVTPLVPFTPGDAFTALSRAAAPGTTVLLQQFAVNLRVAVGLSAHDTAGLVVEQCTFRLDFTSLRVAANIFAAGILARGDHTHSAVTDCSFTTAPVPDTVPFYDLATVDPATDARPSPPYRLTFGYLQIPTWTQSSNLTAGPSMNVGVLNDVAIEGCRFDGPTVPVLAIAQLGTVRLENNTVQECYGGFWLLSPADSIQATGFELVPTSHGIANNELAAVGLSVLGDGILVLTLAMARVLPATPPTGAHAKGHVLAPVTEATASLAAQQMRNLLAQAIGNLVSAAAPAAATASEPATAAPATKLLSHLVADVHNMFSRQQPAAAPAPPQPAAVADPAVRESTTELTPTQTPGRAAAAAASDPAAPASRLDLLRRFLPALDNALSNIGAEAAQMPPAADTGTSAVLRLALSGNQIDAIVKNSYSGPGLLLMDTTATFGSIMLTGNRIASRFPRGRRP